jgi:hypothetical protein
VYVKGFAARRSFRGGKTRRFGVTGSSWRFFRLRLLHDGQNSTTSGFVDQPRGTSFVHSPEARFWIFSVGRRPPLISRDSLRPRNVRTTPAVGTASVRARRIGKLLSDARWSKAASSSAKTAIIRSTLNNRRRGIGRIDFGGPKSRSQISKNIMS